ncbi:DUF4870 domain-containing protein [Lysobacter sp. A3-1-A15]|uniref:DUF4870 domain-containing protein n=1 Tax=Novilysobacter viscosus TaxID=3098602 RepID=UPI002EDA42E1
MNASVHDSSLVTTTPSTSERQWALAAHLAALLLALMTSWLVGVAGVVGALAVWLLKRDDSRFVADHALEAVNFNLSMLIYSCIAVAIGIALVGISIITLGLGLLLTIPAGLMLLVAVAGIALLWLVGSILAMVAAWEGRAYRYPLSIRLLG